MKKVVAFAGSTSSQSINKKLVSYAVSLLDKVNSTVLDLNDYELPLFSEDKESEIGHPEAARKFLECLGDADGIVISFAEHNGSYAVGYKNIFDWCSRINAKVFQDKPMVMLSTSPGPGGASSVLMAAVSSAPYFDGQVKGSLSIPEFHKNFDSQEGKLTSPNLNKKLVTVMQMLNL